MKNRQELAFIKNVLNNMPEDWLRLTTHRLDIYDEDLAKVQFLDRFEELYANNDGSNASLAALPTAYDYIRLGHPLSSILEWTLAKLNQTNPNNVVAFQSQTVPILAILRKNLLDKIQTQIVYSQSLPVGFDPDLLREVYGYHFQLKKISPSEELKHFPGSTVYFSENDAFGNFSFPSETDFYVGGYGELGSVLLVNAGNNADNENYISEIQHVRRRETVAMTPTNCYTAIKRLLEEPVDQNPSHNLPENKKRVEDEIKAITATTSAPLVASSGLSMQYAIMMGAIDQAMELYPEKDIKFIVPPNCYGGTNDQARRVAACVDRVAIVDLLVDGQNNMVQSLDTVLEEVGKQDAVPFIIAEIPTNPRVEVPNLDELKSVLASPRYTRTGKKAVAPVFILDQTFCPDVPFLGEGEILSTVRALSYASGSKFPSGGLSTAGYCVGNDITRELMERIQVHLELCDNEATALQYQILAQQLPSMKERIAQAYKNTVEFVKFIRATLPQAKINFVSEALAERGFTPSVFSLDLPTYGETEEAREANKRALNLKLINLMISKIPQESKFCVSYGQLKGCYWTIPATSTQGTTKEGDKDYIVRVSVSPQLNLDLHKKVFEEFVENHMGFVQN